MTTRIKVRTVGKGLACVCVVGSFAAAIPAYAAFLEGKTVSVNLRHQTSPSDNEVIVGNVDVIVGPGVELTGFGMFDNPPLPALVDIDLSDTHIRITLIIDQPPSEIETLSFLDPNDSIPPFDSVKLNPATNWAGFQGNRVLAQGNGIRNNAGGLFGLKGQFILLDMVPEPAAAILILGAVASLAMHARRRRARSSPERIRGSG